jgi:hypothetical protein
MRLDKKWLVQGTIFTGMPTARLEFQPYGHEQIQKLNNARNSSHAAA